MGLYSSLSAEQKEIIHDKTKSSERESPEFMTGIAKFILSAYNDAVAAFDDKDKSKDKNKDMLICDKYAIFLTSIGKDILNSVAKGKYADLNKTQRKIMSPRIIFCVQERQAVG